MRIAVDIDDTLNVVDRISRPSAYIKRNNLPFRLINENTGAFLDTFDWKSEDVAAFMREGGITIFTDAPVRKGACEALGRLREEGHEIIILTARQRDWFGNPEKLSRDWLEKRRIPYDEIVAEIQMDDKARFCREHGISAIVDDRVDVCLEAERQGVRAVLAVCRYNLPRAHEVPLGGANWGQIEQALRFIIKSKEGAGTRG